MTIISDPAKADALNREIVTLLDKGAIVPVNPRWTGGVLFPVLSGPEAYRRSATDTRPAGPECISTGDTISHATHFRGAAGSVPGEWFTSIDLRDAYFHVPIAPSHQRFLRFAFQGKHFQFRVLPFGLSLSPRVFTRVVAAALSPLQAQGVKILRYLDDWLICSPSYEQAVRDTETVLAHVHRLGLTVNEDKSNLVPAQATVFLGVALDTVAMMARPSPRRVDDIMATVAAFQDGAVLPFLQYLKLLGKLVAASSTVPLGLLSLRPMQMWLNGLQLDSTRIVHRQKRLRVSSQCLLSLSQWRDHRWVTQGVPLGQLPARREVISTDASATGWGATWQGRAVQGIWPPCLACPRTVGQPFSGLSPEPSGGNQISPTDAAVTSAVGLGVDQLCQSARNVHTGTEESGGRFPLPSDTVARGVETPSGGGREYLEGLWRGRGGSLCLTGVGPLSPVVLPVRPSQSIRPGCSGSQLAQRSPLRVPSFSNDSSDSAESPTRGPQTSPGGAVLAREDLVSTAAQALLRLADAPPLQSRSPITAGRASVSSPSRSPPAMGLAASGPSEFSGFSGAIADTIANARAPSTRRLYANRWKLFETWCLEHGHDAVQCPIATVLEFLQLLLDRGLTPSTLKVYVAAISCWHCEVNGTTVGHDRNVSLFLKGARRLNPPRRPMSPSWDLSLVLDVLQSPPFEPVNQVSLKWLSWKTAFLLAMASGKRVSELQALSISDACCRWHADGSGVTLWPVASFRPKVLSSASIISPLQLARFGTGSSNEPLCPVRALEAYISATAEMRRSERLFVCYAGSRKGSALSTQRLARWVVEVIKHAYVSQNRPVPAGVRCHSTRSLSTSWAAMHGVPLEEICAAASWSSQSTFTRFYRVNLIPAHPLDGILRQHRSPTL
ncbi:hypothetical protein WMY93_016138 [Mugilogobius chulae]|uniref:ribonuclease H n=1 Tax=Mugilogobius chulae TaxID=88201 RepID=A0AAW0NWZ8_9GOBI